MKSPTAESRWADAAREINDVYAAEYPWFFIPNVFAVASDGLKLRFGAVGAPVNLWAMADRTGIRRGGTRGRDLARGNVR